QARASTDSVVSDAREQQRIRARVRGLSSADRRPGRPILGPDQVQHGRLRRLRVAAGASGIEDGVGWRGLADESVHAASLDARVCERTLWRLRWGAGSFVRLRLVLIWA